MKDNPFKTVKRKDLPKLDTVILIKSPTEDLVERLQNFDGKRVAPIHSLDTADSIVMYGKDADEHIEFLTMLISMAEKQHTITQRSVNQARVTYNDHSFFVSSDGYYVNRANFFQQWKNLMLRICDWHDGAKLNPEQSTLSRHNMNLFALVIADSLRMLKAVRYVNKRD